jgi:predicted O-linked N-acetylglucosamine transferase (SPINDLY family)
MSEFTIQQALDLAVQHQRCGRLQEAEQVYRQILLVQPQNADALHLLGVLAHQAGRHEVAIDLIRGAIAMRPDFATALCNLSTALKANGQIDEAITVCRQAVALDRSLAEAHNNLGAALKERKEYEEAIAECRAAIALRPDYAHAWNNLGNALTLSGQSDSGISAYRQAIALQPQYVEAHYNLAGALRDKGELDESLAACRTALSLQPNSAEAHLVMGNVFNDQGRRAEAIAAYRDAATCNPKLAAAFNNLSNVLVTVGQPEAAIAAARHALVLQPEYADACSNLGNALKDIGEFDDALTAYRKGIAIDPGYSLIDSSLACALNFHPGFDAKAIAGELSRWNRQHAKPLEQYIQPHANDRNPERRLRIGYVSPDFSNHVVGHNLLPLFREHDRRQFEIVCYSQSAASDQITAEFQDRADCWRSIFRRSDKEVAAQIREDQIDILVDLTLHLASNRLLVFAYKPAPVQVTYLGYCGSTGLDTMDYRLSDPYLDPLESDLNCYSEATVRLPRTYWCYQPAGETPDPAPLPALRNGFITFGCLNNFAKVSPAAIDLWARILVELADSRMILHSNAAEHLERPMRRFEELGVDRNRVRFIGGQPWAKYAETYSQIDIALDPFPYGGGITTCDALWMGVPVVSLSGQTAVGRGGRSILSNLGMPELVAFTTDQYAQIATDLARDLDRINGLRRSMRQRMLASPLMDAPGFARDVEAAYRQMWRTWCEKS